MGQEGGKNDSLVRTGACSGARCSCIGEGVRQGCPVGKALTAKPDSPSLCFHPALSALTVPFCLPAVTSSAENTGF